MIPACPHCKVTGKIQVVTAETRPVEQVILLCTDCRAIIISTRLPGSVSWAQSIFLGVETQAALIETIGHESFRLGLPTPTIRVLS